MADPFYQPFTSPRATEPHLETLIERLKALDASAGVQHQWGSPNYIVKKSTIWTTPQRNAAQNVINTSPANSPQLAAQAYIDRLPISERAWKELEVEEFNRHRSALRALGAPGLPDLTYPDIIAAWRTKAGEIS